MIFDHGRNLRATNTMLWIYCDSIVSVPSTAYDEQTVKIY